MSASTVLVLRTRNADMTAYGGFRWPASGPVECPDWKPTAECGHGLHGLLWGAGDAGLLSSDADAKWLLVEVEASAIVKIDDRKVKFPRGRVVYCGERAGAIDRLWREAPANTPIVFSRREAGDDSTLTAGDRSTLTAGDDSTFTAGDGATFTGRWWDGNRWRVAVFIVGENGIEPNVTYRFRAGELIREAQPATEGA